MKKSIKVLLIFLWVCMIIVGLSACGDSAGIDKADLINIPIAKESGYVSATLPNATVSLEDDTEVEGDLSGQLETFQGIFDRQVSMAQGEEKVVPPNQNEIFKAVLLGDSPFIYCPDENAETMVITDVPALFDEYDPLMKIWEFSVVDLNGDGEDEVILFVVGVAGDMGGKIILHQIGNKVYGYITDNRTLMDLKMDGSYGYSDPTGVTEVGIAAIVDFSEAEYTVDKITYATGTYRGWDTFVADYQPVTEEEYLDALSKQEQKQNVEWHEFTDENIKTLF